MKELRKKIKFHFKEVYKKLNVTEDIVNLEKDMLAVINRHSKNALEESKIILERMVNLAQTSIILNFDNDFQLIFAYFSLWQHDLRLEYEMIPLLKLTCEEKKDYLDLNAAIVLTLKKLRKQVKQLNDPSLLAEFNKINKNVKDLISDKTSCKVKKKRTDALMEQLSIEKCKENELMAFLNLAVLLFNSKEFIKGHIEFYDEYFS